MYIDHRPEKIKRKGNKKKKALPVVLYGCETWSLALREEYRYLKDVQGI